MHPNSSCQLEFESESGLSPTAGRSETAEWQSRDSGKLNPVGEPDLTVPRILNNRVLLGRSLIHDAEGIP